MKGRSFRFFIAGLLVLVITPVMVEAGFMGDRRDWSTADRSSAGTAPDPAEVREAVIQVYAARTWGRRGAVATHSWIILKPEGASGFTRYDMVGWRGSGVRKNGYVVDGRWFGSEPKILLDIRGARAAALVPRIEAAVDSYPYADDYRTWPGPNSNTFIAWIGRQVPELRLHMPPTAIGKDYLGGARILGPTVSNTGVQLSLAGAFGVSVAAVEGFEVNLFGLVLGLDFMRPAIKLPGVGRLGLPQATD